MDKHDALTQDALKRLLDYNPETGNFTWRVRRGGRGKIGFIAGSVDTKGRRQIKVFGQVHFAHRLAFLWMTGEWPKVVVDHIDRDFTNNAWKNLREATHTENCINRVASRKVADNQHLPKGVHPLKSGRFYAVIGTHSKTRRIGTFDTPEDAAKAFAKAALERNSDFVPPDIILENHSS